jgi:proteasome accessory factor C
VSGPAGAQVERIISLVAELSGRAARGERDATVTELAARFGTTPQQIRRDVVTLTTVGDDAESEWLSSLSVMLEGDRLSISSHGPFRRPVRFTPLELAAIQVGLAGESDVPSATSKDLAALLAGASGTAEALRVLPQPAEGEARVVRLALNAIDERRMLTIKYAGAQDRVGTTRAVEPRDVMYDQGRWYVVAWCRKADGWRTFRADRVLDVALGTEVFAPRAAAPPVLETGGVFHADDEPDSVEVLFSPRVARWIRERYPDARPGDDGSALLTYQVADPQWLVQTVLQYGAEAEVIGPPAYRMVMRSAVAA